MAMQKQNQQSINKNPSIGVNLGNNIITIYFNNIFYQINTEITINLNTKNIIIGQQPTSLQQKLQAKYKSLKQDKQDQNQIQTHKQYIKPKRLIDILDLFVKNFTQKDNLTQLKQKDIFIDKLPQCFVYYGHEYKQRDDNGIYIILDKGMSIKQSDTMINRKNNKQQNQQHNDHIVQKANQQTIRLDQSIYLILAQTIKQIITNYINSQSKQSKLNQKYQTIQIVINYYGFQGNPYLTSLSNLQSIFTNSKYNHIKTNINFIYSTTSLAIYFYIQHLIKQLKISLKKSTLISCLEFGSRGCAFSIYKLYSSSQNVIQTLQHFSFQFGGVDITRIVMDLIIDHVKLYKGVNIMSTPQMIHQLYKLAQQTKLALSQTQQVFVRIQGYPLQQPYGFYLKRYNLEKKISQKILIIIRQIDNLWKKYNRQIKYFIVSGQSCNIPLFKQNFHQKILKSSNVAIVKTNKFWIAKGNYLWKQSGVIILQKSQSSICVRGDEQYIERILQKGSQMPVRLVKYIQFPRGQLTYTLRFYENEIQFGRYQIQSKNLQWGQNMNFVLQKQENKSICVYSTKYLGDIYMKGHRLCRQVLLNEKFNLKVSLNKVTDPIIMK